MPEGLDVAVRMLARREHSLGELRKKLGQRGFSVEQIDAVLDVCVRRNLQSDLRFAEMLCRSRVSRGYGPHVIRGLLQQAGVSADMITTVLDAAADEVDWQDALMRVWEKKFKDRAAPIQKQWQFLRYRGFPEANIKHLFEMMNQV